MIEDRRDFEVSKPLKQITHEDNLLFKRGLHRRVYNRLISLGLKKVNSEMAEDWGKMENDIKQVKTTLDKVMFILRGSPEDGATGIVQLVKELSIQFGVMVGDIAHLMSFKKRTEASNIDEERREREKLSRELEIQRLTIEKERILAEADRAKEKMKADELRYKKESRVKNWTIAATIAVNLILFLLNKFLS